MSLLEVQGLRAGYGRGAVLHDLSFGVEPGEVVAILGPNGAGKTTLLRAISGIVRTKGHIRLRGREIAGLAPQRIARAGIAHVPQGRGTFMAMTVDENLRLGGWCRPRSDRARGLEQVFGLFPRLKERRSQAAGSLSGGEQQMLALGRALMGQPSLLLLDEPSLGLAPQVTSAVLDALVQVNSQFGTAVVIVEQNAQLVLPLAVRAHVIEHGQIVLTGNGADLENDARVREAYLGA